MSKRERIPSALRVAVWNHYNGKIYEAKCYTNCGEIITAHNFECGHIIADSKGGTVELSNLRPICSNCNKSMGNKNMEEFIQQYGFKKNDIKNKTPKSNTVINEENINSKSTSELTYKELQYLCKKNKIKSNMKREELELIINNVNNNNKIDNKYLSSKHPDYKSDAVTNDNFITNAVQYLKSFF